MANAGDDRRQERLEPRCDDVAQQRVDDVDLSDVSSHLTDAESQYSYHDGSDPSEDGVSRGKDLAETDAAVIAPSLDGIAASVESPSKHLLRLWITVLPWRLYEGLGSSAVEALGLNPKKGVQVMLTTNEDYLASATRPQVKWVRQVSPEDIKKGHELSDGSVLDAFSLQWTLRKRVEEALSREWAADLRRSHGDESAGHQDFRKSSFATSGRAPRHGADGGNGEDMDDVAGGLGPESASYQEVVKTIAECTGASVELSEYTLRMTKCQNEAKLTLLDEDSRTSLEVALFEDRANDSKKLRADFPGVNEQIVERAITANPGSRERQRSHVCRAREVERSRLPRPDQQQQDQGMGEHKRRADSGSLSRLRQKLKRLARTRDAGKTTPFQLGGRTSHDAGLAGEAASAEHFAINLTKEEREERRAWLESIADTNLPVRMALLMIDKLRNANKYCLVCDRPIDGYLPAVPIVCSKDLCVMSSEDIGCGTDVESQVEMKGDTVDLLVDLFTMAMNGPRPEIGFPHAVVWEGRAAFKLGLNESRCDVSKLRVVLDMLPSITEMQECIKRKREKHGEGISPLEPCSSVPTSPGGTPTVHEGGTVDAGEGVSNAQEASGEILSLREALSERSPLTYVLLRWLLAANRAHLRPLAEEEKIQEIPCEKQFMLVTGTAEREAKFQMMKREAAAASGGDGSFFAFHGSGASNWHGILREGLKSMSGTKYQTTGAAFGKGIYMAEYIQIARGYAHNDRSHWSNARVAGPAVIIAVCEVVDRNRAEWATGPDKQYFVVPDEECVATRFLLINPRTTVNISASSIKLNLRS